LGTDLVVLVLCLVVKGFEIGFFPIGESMAYAFGHEGSVILLLIFAFSLGVGTTIAEPALIAVAEKAAEVAAIGNAIPNTEDARSGYASGLRLTVALSVGLAIVIGVLRILKGWPIHYLIIGGYVGVAVHDVFCSRRIYWYRL